MIHKSTIDKRTFKSITLSNGLLCLLISDPDTEKSAAALNVDVGSLEDPVDRMGLAHFCEHMLFMGTTKYPDENEYQQYITKNAGSTNAFTSEVNTNYFFSVANQALEGALDRFAQFFICPLFSESCTEREMKAVDSEYNMNLQNDYWRKFQLFHNTALPESSYNKFMIGNLQTLQHEDTRNRLLEFHKRYYSANVMKLVIYGSQDVQQLEQWANTYFQTIENKNLQSPSYKVSPFNQTNLGQLIKYVPIKNQDYLEFLYVIDYLYPHYRGCPGKYLSHLIGHEGENSLLSLLVKEDLAQELSAGPSNNMKQFSDMSIRIKLTQKGLGNYTRVVQYVTEYIEMLKLKGPQEWVFKEIQVIKQLEFNFLEKSDPFNFVCTLASRMQLYPIEDVLKQPYLMETYNPELITNITNQLTSDKLVLFLSSQSFTGQLGNKEHYFGTEYSQAKFSEELNAAFTNAKTTISPQLNLPPQNTYLPEHTNLLPPQNDLPAFPELIYSNDQTLIWFKQDNKFAVPKTVINLRINTIELGYGRLPKTEVIAKIWQAILKNHVREFNYLAEMAKIDPSIQLAANGLEISVSGFSDSISRFVLGMFSKILSFNIEEYKDQYQSTFQKIHQELENFKRLPPYQQVHSYLSVVLRDGSSFDPEELIAQLQNITFEDVVYFQKHFLSRCRFEWLIMGNLLKEEAIQIGLKSQELFNAKVLKQENVLSIRPVQLLSDKVVNFTYNLTEPTETNSGIVVHYQIGSCELRKQLLNDILQTITKTPFFAQLRTTEQLGYAVFSLVSDIRGVYGFTYLIQSNAKCPHYVQQRIRLFLNENLNKLVTELSEADFEGFKNSVKVQLLEKDTSLNKESARMWQEVQKHQRLFDRKQQQLAILPEITLVELQEHFKNNLINNTKQFEIHAIAPTHVEEQGTFESNATVFRSAEALKRKLGLYPDYYYQ